MDRPQAHARMATLRVRGCVSQGENAHASRDMRYLGHGGHSSEVFEGSHGVERGLEATGRARLGRRRRRAGGCGRVSERSDDVRQVSRRRNVTLRSERMPRRLGEDRKATRRDRKDGENF